MAEKPVFTHEQIIHNLVVNTGPDEGDWFMRSWTADGLPYPAEVSFAFPLTAPDSDLVDNFGEDLGDIIGIGAEEEEGFVWRSEYTGQVFEAFGLWDDLMKMKLYNSFTADAQITLAFSNETKDNGSYMASDTEGVGDGDDEGFVTAQIWLNNGWAEYHRPVIYGERAMEIFLHEIGHALGLFHPGGYDAGDGGNITYATHAEFRQDTRQYTLMSYFNAGSDGSGVSLARPNPRIDPGHPVFGSPFLITYPQTPMLYDIAAIQRKYDPDPTTRTSDTTYGFNATAGRVVFDFTNNPYPVVSIYDAGGSDTIDVSGWTMNQTVDLRPGTFSSVGGLLQNLSIAFQPEARFGIDARIENARGGGGTDTLIGNDADNELEGGVGPDSLDGKEGRDTASYRNAAAGVMADLLTNGFNTGEAQGDLYNSIENLRGSAFDDTLNGNDFANMLHGMNGDDWLDGRGGADFLNGGGGDRDWVTYQYALSRVWADLRVTAPGGFGVGEAAGDWFAGVENLLGSVYNDTLIGDDGANRIRGGDSRPVTLLAPDNDLLMGFGGNDTLQGALGDDTLNGGSGADRLEGREGTDTASYDMATGPVTADLINPALNTGEAAGDVYDSIENLTGSGFGDTLRGSLDANLIHGGPGGHDVLMGLGGEDTLNGGDGNDQLFGGLGNDILQGDLGDDTLYGGGGDDEFQGGGGFDLVSFADLAGPIYIDFAPGLFSPVLSLNPLRLFSIEDIEGTPFADELYGRANEANYFRGGAGNDTIGGRGDGDVIAGEQGDDVIIVTGNELSVNGDGGASLGQFDTLAVGGLAGVFNWATNSFAVDGKGIFQVIGFEMARGGAGGDRFTANGEYLSFYGQGGNDTLTGGHGDNVIEGGDGADVLTFGLGFDYADYRSDTAGVLADIRAYIAAGGHAQGDAWLDRPEGLMGGAGNDSLGGSEAGNRILGRGGNDYVSAYGGDDTVEGGDGHDSLEGGLGADALSGGAGDDVLSDNEDLLLLTAADDASDDTLSGGAGNDRLLARSGADLLDGGDGQDTLAGGAGDDTLTGDAGDDSLDGGTGTGDVAVFQGDRAQFQIHSSGGGFLVTDLRPGPLLGTDRLQGIEVLRFSDGDVATASLEAPTASLAIAALNADRAEGQSGPTAFTFIVTRSGDLSGTSSVAWATTGSGARPAASADFTGGTTAQRGTLTFAAGETTQTITVQIAGDTRFEGDEGFTVTLSNPSAGTSITTASATGVIREDDIITGTAANDTLTGTSFADSIRGLAGDDVIQGGSGDDTIEGNEGADTMAGGTGADSLIGGEGFDSASYFTAGAAVALSLATGGTLGDAQGDRFQGIEAVLGSAFADAITGDDQANFLNGNAGNDTLLGGAGDDTLQGGAGADSLLGGEGRDLLTFLSNIALAVDLNSGGTAGEAAGDAYSGIEDVIGRASGDTILGSAVANLLDGAEGDDSLAGREGNDTLVGGTGNDTLLGGAGDDSLSGGGGEDMVSYADALGAVTVSLALLGAQATGGAGLDVLSGFENLTGSGFADRLTGDGLANLLVGGAGNDTLIGGEGNDTLEGGGGGDVLTGGAGVDRFIFRTAEDSLPRLSGRDVITDFSRALQERIDLRGIDANPYLEGDQAFTWITGDFTGAAGELSVVSFPGGTHRVRMDLDGDGAEDMAITVMVNIRSMAITDFFL